MKKILIFAVAAAAMCSCSNKNAYTIKGEFDGLEGTLYLYDGEDVIDSATVENGKFSFKGIADAPGQRYILDSREGRPQEFGARLFVEPGTIIIAADSTMPQAKVATGTPANDASAAFSKEATALTDEYRNPETTQERRDAIETEFDALTKSAVEENRDNLFGAMMLASNMAYGLSGQELLDEIAKFTPEMQQTKMLTELKTTAESKLKTDIGQPYIDIAQPNAEGETVTLKSVVENPANKYVLIDFWASWCSPCMGEVPVLKKTYDEFHAKGFEIYGVSFDKDKEKWLGAVKDNGMSWIHVSELNAFDNQAAKDYAIQGIPSNFLIDAEGKIVASNLRGDALYEKISELLAE